MSDQATIKPGSFIVLEGLDATGKSTILKKFQTMAEHGSFTHPLLTTHQPSGGSAVGNAVYAVTENGDIASPWARQFLHLASHAEHYVRDIIPALDRGVPVIMDRCWWSTIAYGWYGGAIRNDAGIKFQQFLDIVLLPTLGRMPDLVFLFTEPHQEDRHNTPEVAEGYQNLFTMFARHTVKVPMGTEDEQFAFVLSTLAARDLA